MTEAQIWFLLIFSVPFVPAVVVFFLIKPESGDARVGGSIPLFKDLRLELAGSIATYVIIVIFSIIAYVVLARHETIVGSMLLNPVTPEGRLADPARINWDEAKLPPVKLVGSEKATFPIGFSYDRARRGYVSSTPLKILRSSIGSRVELQAGENIAFFGLPPKSFIDLESSMKAEIMIKDEMFVDWTVRLDWQFAEYDLDRMEVKQMKVYILTDNTRLGMTRVNLNSWSIRGLRELLLSIYRLEKDSTDELLQAYSKNVKLPNGFNSAIAELSAKIKEITNKSSRVGHDEWRWPHAEPFAAPVTSAGAASILFAPAPRVTLPSTEGPGSSIAVVIKTLAALPPGWVAKPAPLSTNFDYVTENALISIALSGGLLFCSSPSEITLSGPGGSRPVSPSLISRGHDWKWVSLTAVRRTSKIEVPLEWKKRESCSSSN